MILIKLFQFLLFSLLVVIIVVVAAVVLLPILLEVWSLVNVYSVFLVPYLTINLQEQFTDLDR